MHNKKIQALVVAGLLTVGVIGGTLAWFTSQDQVTNIFNTGSVTDPEDGLDAGIDVEENFPDKDGNQIKPDKNGNYIYPDSITPNQTLAKEVWVESKANYDQIVRGRVVKNFIDPTTNKVVTHWVEGEKGKIIYGDSNLQNGKSLNLNYIVLADNFNENDKAPEGWTIETITETNTLKSDTSSETNWYYYNKVVTPHNGETHTTCKTTDLLKKVTLSKDAGNEYKNLRFDVKVEGESIQATNGAIKDESVWKNVPNNIKELDKSTSTIPQP